MPKDRRGARKERVAREVLGCSRECRSAGRRVGWGGNGESSARRWRPGESGTRTRRGGSLACAALPGRRAARGRVGNGWVEISEHTAAPMRGEWFAGAVCVRGTFRRRFAWAGAGRACPASPGTAEPLRSHRACSFPGPRAARGLSHLPAGAVSTPGGRRERLAEGLRAAGCALPGSGRRAARPKPGPAAAH